VNLDHKELKEATDEIEKNLEKMNLDHYDEEEGIYIAQFMCNDYRFAGIYRRVGKTKE
jgi:hypothetical protein